MSLVTLGRVRGGSILASSRLLVTAHLPSKVEMASFPAIYRRAMAGLVIWIVLTIVVIVALLVVPNDLPIDGRSRNPDPVKAGVAMPVRFESIEARPVFSRSRRPVTEAAPQPPTIAVHDYSVRVVGVYIDGTVSKAFMASDSNAAGAWMTRGETIGGWQILAIHPTSVDLGANADRLAVSIDPNRVGGH